MSDGPNEAPPRISVAWASVRRQEPVSIGSIGSIGGQHP